MRFAQDGWKKKNMVSKYFPNDDLGLIAAQRTVKDKVIKGSPNMCICWNYPRIIPFLVGESL